MIFVLILSILATMLAVLSFCLVVNPSLWTRLWNPWRKLVGVGHPADERQLLGIRLRGAMAGLVFLSSAILLPIATLDASPPPGSDVRNPLPASPSDAPDAGNENQLSSSNRSESDAFMTGDSNIP